MALLRLASAPLLLALALLLAEAAAAADARPVELPLASGKTIRGVVESADALEVVVRVGPEEVRRVPWAQLLPRGVYRARAALAPPADGEARLALAELAVELGLHAEAREEYEKALALGALDETRFRRVVAAAEREAVETGVHRALKHAEQGEWEAALQTARDLKLHFGGAPNAGAVDRLIADILKRVRELQEETELERRELERITLEAERNKEILRRRTQALDLVQVGLREAERAAEARERGNVTRARRYAEAGDEAFMQARRHLGRLRRILAPEHPTHRDVLARLNELDRHQFDLLLATARFFWLERIYSKAEEFAARASYIDPVHPDLLELREHLRSSRIRYRLSDVTNARPIVR